MQSFSSILISRTDSIGDVMLTLPIATLLKQRFPEAHIGFLGRNYTRSVVACCTAVDEFVELNDFLSPSPLSQRWAAIIHVFPRKEIAWKALKAGIPLRIGTRSRPYHWVTCNRLLPLSRRHSLLHEAQLNTQLLAPFGIHESFGTEQLGRLYSFARIQPLPEGLKALLLPGKKHFILHPKSQGSAREWGLTNFAGLARILTQQGFQVFISGTAAERKLMQPLFDLLQENEATDITGRMDLQQFISFIDACDGLVAASTGPLHIAAALGKMAVGLYPSIRPMHAGRWGPLGSQAVALALPEDCDRCRKDPAACTCLSSIQPLTVAEKIQDLIRDEFEEH